MVNFFSHVFLLSLHPVKELVLHVIYECQHILGSLSPRSVICHYMHRGMWGRLMWDDKSSLFAAALKGLYHLFWPVNLENVTLLLLFNQKQTHCVVSEFLSWCKIALLTVSVWRSWASVNSSSLKMLSSSWLLPVTVMAFWSTTSKRTNQFLTDSDSSVGIFFFFWWLTKQLAVLSISLPAICPLFVNKIVAYNSICHFCWRTLMQYFLSM